jgi:CelD/BcsL family acetyltransferase involved in cellulose biosynthesis
MPYGLDGWIRQSGVCPVVQLPAKVEQFYESLNSTHRRKVLKAKRQLRNEIGEIEFSRAQELNYGLYLNDLFRLHEAAWKARHKSGVLSDSRVQLFHQSLCKEFIENGHACLYKLKAGDAVISVVYGFIAKDRYYSYIGGFDPEYARYSPGNVILLHVMEDCINNGIKEFDFLRGSELYKYSWGAIDRPNFELTIE